MGYSTAVLVVAVLAAVVAIATTGGRLPASVADLGRVATAGAIVTAIGLVGLSFAFSTTLFGLAHVAYLLLVVSVPLVLGSWFARSRVTGDRRVLGLAAGAVAALIAVAGVWATHVEPNLLRVDRARLVTSAATSPLRVGVLADLQTPNIGEHERDAVAKLIAEQPDLVVVPGDLFQGSASTIAENRQDFVDLLAELVDAVGQVIVVSGDADRAATLRPIVFDARANFLDNGILETTIAGVDVRVAGVEVHGRDPGRAQTLAALETPTDRLTLLVAHRPDVVYDLAPGADVDLIVSGHTHGGQVAIPLIGPVVTFSDIPRALAGGGLGEVDGIPIYVSTGVGLERKKAPQVRFLVRPSVGIIDVVLAG